MDRHGLEHERVLAFWFDELSPKAWFEKNDDVDRRLRSEFLDTWETVSRETDQRQWLTSPPLALAALIVLDQIPRNLFRGTARAFASDPQALDLARAAIESGLDLDVDRDRRLFFYLPFEHSEDLADQHRSLELFGRLGNPDDLRFAQAHHAIIDRFGRFPHRNAILMRSSTADEVAFLATPGSSF